VFFGGLLVVCGRAREPEFVHVLRERLHLFKRRIRPHTVAQKATEEQATEEHRKTLKKSKQRKRMISLCVIRCFSVA
jgi:hypothetical protein